MEALIRPIAIEGVSLLAGLEAMEDLNVTCSLGDGAAPVRPPRRADRGGRRATTCALIDCPPNVQLCSWAALVAADGVVVPLQAEDYGAEGLVAIRASITRARHEANPSLQLIGYLDRDVQQDAGGAHLL